MEKITSLLYHYTHSDPENSNPNPTTPFLFSPNTNLYRASIISSLPFPLSLIFLSLILLGFFLSDKALHSLRRRWSSNSLPSTSISKLAAVASRWHL